MAPAEAPAELGGGVVLRGAAVSAEPRLVRRPVSRPAPPATPAPHREPVIPQGAVPAGVEPGPSAAPPSPDGSGAGGSAPAERDVEADAARRAAVEAAVQSGRERGFAQGRDEGRRQGFPVGRDAGRQAFEKDARDARDAIASRVALLDRAVAALSGEMERRLAAAEDDMIALCHAVVCRILGEELVKPEGVAALVRQAVREAGGRGAVAIHLHPRDAATLEGDPQLAGWMRQHAAGGAVQLVGDERVALGGCLVRFAEGSLDARLETQLASLREVLVTARNRRAAEPAPAAAPVHGGPGPARAEGEG